MGSARNDEGTTGRAGGHAPDLDMLTAGSHVRFLAWTAGHTELERKATEARGALDSSRLSLEAFQMAISSRHLAT